jgi:hypothetical protein
VYGSGLIAREGVLVRHNVDPSELELCRRLAHEVEGIFADTLVGMGSASDDTFSEFFITSNVDDTNPERIDDQFIRSRFGGTIFPLATISVEPLQGQGTWWSEVCAWVGDYEENEREEYLRPWREAIKWFHDQPEFKDCAFVRIGEKFALRKVPKAEYPSGTKLTGCVLPRLMIGLTKNGSLSGVFGYSVQS